jgi:hypothetical protein
LSGTETKILLRNQGMPVVDAYEGHLTTDTTAVIHSVNNDLVVIPGGMAS